MGGGFVGLSLQGAYYSKGPLWPYNTPLKVAILLGGRGLDLGGVTPLRGLQRGVRGASPGKFLNFNPLNLTF